MDTNVNVPIADIVNVMELGQKRGFVAGVIFSIVVVQGAKYLNRKYLRVTPTS